MQKYKKGAVVCNNRKAPTISGWENEENRIPIFEAEKKRTYGLVIADNYIVIDVDDESESQLLLKILRSEKVKFSAMKTTRGIHFYFKKPNNIEIKNSSNKKTPLLITVDPRVGNSFVIVKYVGIKREWIELRENDDEDELPYYLYPIKSKYTLDDLVEGGRNTTLFSLKGELYAQGYNDEQVYNVLRIINDYEIKEPLTESELRSVARKEGHTEDTTSEKLSEKKEKEIKEVKEVLAKHDIVVDDGVENVKQLKLLAVALDIIEKYRYVKLNGIFYYYYINHYKQLSDDELSDHILFVKKDASTRDVTEIKMYINTYTEKKKEDNNYICLKNCILNTSTGETEDLTEDKIITHYIDIEYDAECNDEAMLNYFLSMADGDKKRANLLLQMIAQCLVPNTRTLDNKCFILVGEGKNGKSTFLNLIRRFIGEEYCCSTSMHSICNEPFELFKFKDKLALIGDDLDESYLKNDGNFKKLITGESIEGRRKFKDTVDFSNYGKLFLACNKAPSFNDSNEALRRRIILVEFKTKKDGRENFIKSITTESALKYLMKGCVNMLRAMLVLKKEGKPCFSYTEEQKAETLKMLEATDSIKQFLIEEFKIIDKASDDEMYTSGDINNIFRLPSRVVYALYTHYCKDTGIKQKSYREFNKDIKRLLSTDGTTIKYFDTKLCNVDSELYDSLYRSSDTIPIYVNVGKFTAYKKGNKTDEAIRVLYNSIEEEEEEESEREKEEAEEEKGAQKEMQFFLDGEGEDFESEETDEGCEEEEEKMEKKTILIKKAQLEEGEAEEEQEKRKKIFWDKFNNTIKELIDAVDYVVKEEEAREFIKKRMKLNDDQLDIVLRKTKDDDNCLWRYETLNNLTLECTLWSWHDKKNAVDFPLYRENKNHKKRR